MSISFRGIHVSFEVQFFSLFNIPKSYCPCSIRSTRRQLRSVTFRMKALYIYRCIPLSTRKVLRNLQQTINVREVQGQITLDCIIFISFTNTNFGSHHIQSFRPKQSSLLISPCPFHLTLFIAIFDLRGLLALHAATSECLLCKDLSMKIQVRTHLISSMKFIFERVQRCLD